MQSYGGPVLASPHIYGIVFASEGISEGQNGDIQPAFKIFAGLHNFIPKAIRAADQVAVRLAVAPDFPAGARHLFDLSGCQITWITHILHDDVEYAGESIPLHDGKGVGIVIEVTVVKRENNWLARQRRAYGEVFIQLAQSNRGKAAIVQQLHLCFEHVWRHRQPVTNTILGKWRCRDIMVHKDWHVGSAHYPIGCGRSNRQEWQHGGWFWLSRHCRCHRLGGCRVSGCWSARWNVSGRSRGSHSSGRVS